MPGNFPMYQGQAFQPSGGPQPMSPEDKLRSMIQTLQGAPNDVLMMIQRILGRPPADSGQQQQWQNLYPMPPAIRGGIPGINGAMPMQPAEPPAYPTMQSGGFVRG